MVTANGKPAVLLSVNRQPDSNTVQVADEVRQEIESIRPTLPASINLNVFYDQSNIVHESIASVRDAIIIGLFLSGIIIWLFLRDWGTALLTGLVVPVTINGVEPGGSDGKLTWAGEEWTRGDYPRSFTIDPTGHFLYSCNQRADAVVCFHRDIKTGSLAFTDQYTPVGTPAIMRFL